MKWLDIRLVTQDPVWRDSSLQLRRLEDMSVADRESVVALLEEHEDSWAALALPHATGDVLLGKLDHDEAVRRHKLVGLLTRGWMRRTPLVRKLLQLNEEARR